MAKIWIVEDDERIGNLLLTVVRKVGHEALRLYDDRELEKRLSAKEVPDLMLLDLMLRGKTGYEILSDWKRAPKTMRIPVIILSARSAEADKVRGLELGAEDYITKPFGVRELQARIAAALRRVSPAAQPLRAGEIELTPDTRETRVRGEKIALTPKEFELLYCLMRSAGAYVSRAQLLKEVWGYDTADDPSRTVDYHIKSLRKKLNDPADAPRLIETLRGVGYRLQP